MSAEKLEPGWYWVKFEPDMPWEVASFAVNWSFAGWATACESPAIIGPRLTPPGEG